MRCQLPELELRRCPRCACLWANDARKDDGILAAAYARVSSAYFDSLENDPRYTQFYKWLEQLAKHSLIGLSLHAEGDLHVDFHHTTEDTGYVVGEAVSRALGARAP